MCHDSPFSLGPSMFRGLHWTASCVSNFLLFFSFIFPGMIPAHQLSKPLPPGSKWPSSTPAHTTVRKHLGLGPTL